MNYIALGFSQELERCSAKNGPSRRVSRPVMNHFSSAIGRKTRAIGENCNLFAMTCLLTKVGRRCSPDRPNHLAASFSSIERNQAVQKIKIFKSVESELEGLELDVNQWIEKSGARVISITGNIASQTPRGPASSFCQSDILIVVHYETKA